MAPPSYHPYQIPIVQNDYTKAVENSHMPPPHFDGEQGSKANLVEKLHQWLGVCDPTYTKVNKSRMNLRTLPPG